MQLINKVLLVLSVLSLSSCSAIDDQSYFHYFHMHKTSYLKVQEEPLLHIPPELSDNKVQPYYMAPPGPVEITAAPTLIPPGFTPNKVESNRVEPKLKH